MFWEKLQLLSMIQIVMFVLCLLYMLMAQKDIYLSQKMSTVGDTIIASESADAKVGNAMPLKNVPDGFMVHNIEVTSRIRWNICS